jgi:hypothetical protein
MTVPYRMPLTAAREARRLHLHNPQTYTVAMLARRFGVSQPGSARAGRS